MYACSAPVRAEVHIRRVEIVPRRSPTVNTVSGIIILTVFCLDMINKDVCALKFLVTLMDVLPS